MSKRVTLQGRRGGVPVGIEVELERAGPVEAARLKAQWQEYWNEQPVRRRFLTPQSVPAYFRPDANGDPWDLGDLAKQAAFQCEPEELHMVEHAGVDEVLVHAVLVTTAPDGLLREPKRSVVMELLKGCGVDPDRVVWVEYIATAPWLQRDEHRVKDLEIGEVGTAFMLEAIDRAQRQWGPPYWVALHAQGEQAQAKYDAWKMRRLGGDPAESGYPVYLFDHTEAEAFVREKSRA